MIVRPDGEKLVVITQLDHADLSAQMSAHWGNENFDRPQPLSGMILAAYSHDDGWRLWDDRPTLNPETRRPSDFYQLPVDDILRIHQDTIDLVRRKDPYAHLMVSMHRTGLCKGRYGTEPGWELRHKGGLSSGVREFVEREEEWQKVTKVNLLKDGRYGASLDETHVWTNYRLIQVWDRLSLYLCRGRPVEAEIHPTPRKYEQEDVTLVLKPLTDRVVGIDPWPFDTNPFDVSIRCHIMDDREYDDSEEVASHFYRAPRTSLDFRFVDGDGEP